MDVSLTQSHDIFVFSCEGSEVFRICVVSDSRAAFHNQKRCDMSHVSVGVVFVCKSRNAFAATKRGRQ